MGTHSYISSGESSDWLIYLQVTGASGFVGSHVVSELLREGYTVREDALKPSALPLDVYFVSKALSDLNVAQEHPDIDTTTLHPGFIYGPFGHGQVYNTPASGTNQYVYTLIDGERVRGPPLNSDVRDVAKAHVLALKLAPSSRETPKRFVLS